MDQTLLTPKSVKIRQNIAAGLFVLTDIYWLIQMIFSFNLHFGNLIVQAIFLVGWGLLCSTASNKASRIASIIIIVFALFLFPGPEECAQRPGLSIRFYFSFLSSARSALSFRRPMA